MDGSDDFTEWLRTTITAAGFEGRGGIRQFAITAGTDPGQTSRALTGKTKPSIDYLRAWAKALRARGSQVTLREMLIRAGWVTADELPGPDAAVPTGIDLQEVAESLGVPEERRALFVASVESVAKTFAQTVEGDTVGGSQTGGLSAKR
jgi:transcriptional regulator with XRE-family HTH domain